MQYISSFSARLCNSVFSYTGPRPKRDSGLTAANCETSVLAWINFNILLYKIQMLHMEWCLFNGSVTGTVLRSQLQVGIMVWPKILIWANYLHNLSAVSPSLSLGAIHSFVQRAYQQGHSSTRACWFWFSLRRTAPCKSREQQNVWEKQKKRRLLS